MFLVITSSVVNHYGPLQDHIVGKDSVLFVIYVVARDNLLKILLYFVFYNVCIIKFIIKFALECIENINPKNIVYG